jgi:DNA (cytosine-5)-methyltransferase 1
VIAVDLFAGFGGLSLGAEQAGARVAWAANHWPLAVAAHAAHHPTAIHVCQDLQQADFSELPAHDLLLAAPCCQGLSQAAQPSRARSRRVRRYHDSLRATPYAVAAAADYCRPRAIVVENVPDLLRWEAFGAWVGLLEAFGYRVQWRVLSASRHAKVPQRRDRVFVVAFRGRKRAAEARVLDVPARRREPAFGPCIESDAPGVTWRRVADATPSVRARVAKGRRNHGRRFLTQHVTGHPGVSLAEPIRTVTTKDQWALVDGAWYRPLTLRENARAMGFPDAWRWPVHATRRDVVQGLGNATPPPLARLVVARVGGVL